MGSGRLASRSRKGWASIVLAGALVVTACGNDEEGGSPSGTNGSGASTTAGPSAVENSRFTGNDAFCTPGEAPAEAPQDVEDGITAEEIVIGHVRLQIEDLADIGFALDLGDQNDFAETFVRIVNEQCGGIGGRQLRLVNVEIPVPGFAPDADALHQQACITLAEEERAVATYSNSGAGNPIASCLTGANDVMFLGTYDLSASDYEQSEGRAFAVTHAPTDILAYLVREVADELEGRTIGVVYDDSGPNPEIVEQGLLQTMSDLGLEPARVDLLPCPDGPPCSEGVIPSVQGMIETGVDVIFPLLDTVSLPTYMAELVTQGVEPGQIQFYNSSFQAQDSELVGGKIIEFAGEDAGALYDGAVIIGGSLEGVQRRDGFEPDPFDAMCNAAYAEFSTRTAAEFDPLVSDDEARLHNSVAGHCAFVRMLARAIEAAGPNPTRADIAAALATMGEVDLAGGSPGTFAEGKPTAPDAIVRNVFHFPCELPVENNVGHCLQAESDFLPVPEG